MFWPFHKAQPRKPAAKAKSATKPDVNNLRALQKALPPQVLQFDGHAVELVRKPRKRSISVQVKLNGQIRVSAPKSVALNEIYRFLELQKDWIRAHVLKFNALKRSHPRKRFSEAEFFPFLGEQIPLHFRFARATRLKFHLTSGRFICEVPQSLQMQFNPADEHPEMAPLMRKFYAQAGRKWIGERVGYWADKMQLHPKALSFRGQTTRWGSCSSRGTLSMNWKLMFAPREVIDYVVIHELAHLQHHDHSPRFWSLVSQFDPNFKKNRKWLKEQQYAVDFLAVHSELE